MFCRKPKMSEVSKLRLWWIDETKARETTTSEASETSRLNKKE
jgi:hypothetical protein